MRKIEENTKGKLLKVGEVAQMLHISPQTVRGWTDKGILPVEVSSGGHRSYFEADIKRAALEDKGITNFWCLNFGLLLDTEGNYEILGSDDRVESVPLGRWWNFSNGLEEVVHSLALGEEKIISNHGDTVTQTFEDIPRLSVFPSYYSLDKELLVENIPMIISTIVSGLKEKFEPVPTFVWKDKTTKLSLERE